MPSAPYPDPVPGGPPRSGHRHTTHCYWDVLACGWSCPPAGPAPVAAPTVGTAGTLDAAQPAGPLAVAPV
ncbi:hypothetical protein GCM10023215_12620 [Pseudonocardia yuanmonensis]|uniref:Uncharacterized protein n=1 Tax=Pseudonocardia yuanmonensis TaxID=1095914 RepID=A0ABP8W6S3_9PSEU